MKKIWILILTLVLAFSLCACLDMPAKEKTFTVEGVSIVLNDDFFKMNQAAPEYDFCISSEDIVILGLRVDLAEEGLYGVSAKEYAQVFAGLLEHETEMTEFNGKPVVRYYTTDADGDLQVVNAVFYETEGCYWMLSFISDADDFAEELPEIRKYADSVTFG